MFKRIIAGAMCASLALGGLASCSASGRDKNEKLSIVCTIFPEYDWTKELLGSHSNEADLTYLLNSGEELHSYQPSADDIITISDCDIFIYVGGESDEWVEDALKNRRNKDMKVIELLDVIGNDVKEEEIKEGMEAEEDEEGEEGDSPEYDEHVWLSVKNAETVCREISSALCEKDPDNKEDYEKNLDSYLSKLDAIDKSYEEMLSSAQVKTLVFGDRFPFRYFTDDYGLDYYAAFAGCSSEGSASFDTVIFLAGKIDELNAKTVFTLEGSDHSLAETIISNTSSKNQKIAQLNSLQSVSSADIKNGTTYLSVMQKNYDVLTEALN